MMSPHTMLIQEHFNNSTKRAPSIRLSMRCGDVRRSVISVVSSAGLVRNMREKITNASNTSLVVSMAGTFPTKESLLRAAVHSMFRMIGDGDVAVPVRREGSAR